MAAAQDKINAEAMANTKKKFQKSYFDVLGLCCSSEVPLIENILKSLDGVKEFSVIVTTRTVVVVHDDLLISQLQIVKALNQARLEANVRINGDTSYQKKWPSPFAVASGFLLLLSLFKYVYQPLHWLALGAVAIGIPPIILKAIAAIRNFRLDTNILVLITGSISLASWDFNLTSAMTRLFLLSMVVRTGPAWPVGSEKSGTGGQAGSVLRLDPAKAKTGKNPVARPGNR